MNALRVDAVKLGGVDLVPKFAAINLANSGDLVAAVTGKSILVLSLSIRLASAQTIKFQSGASSDLSGAMTLTVLDLPHSPTGWLKTVAGAKLNAVLGGAVQCSGMLTYVEV